MTPEDAHLALGAYVLGGLSDDDHHVFTEHLRTCVQCQQELGQVSGLPRLLGLVEPPAAPQNDEYAAVPAASEGLVPGAAGPGGFSPRAGNQPPPGTGLDALLAAGRRRRRLRRRWLTAASGIAAAGLVATGVWLGPRLTAEEPRQTVHITATASAGGPAKVGVDLVTRGWGTQVDLACTDMPVGEDLALYVVDASGKATAVASWRGTASGYSKLTGATALGTDEIRAVEVRTSTGMVVASART